MAIILFTALFRFNGYNVVLPIVDQVVDGGSAAEAGLKKGDKILEISGQKIESFDDLRAIVSVSADKKLLFKIERENSFFEQEIMPKNQVRNDILVKKLRLELLVLLQAKVFVKI